MVKQYIRIPTDKMVELVEKYEVRSDTFDENDQIESFFAMERCQPEDDEYYMCINKLEEGDIVYDNGVRTTVNYLSTGHMQPGTPFYFVYPAHFYDRNVIEKIWDIEK